MTTWAIVPVKPLRRAKSRLGSVLGAEERLALSREMLNRVLEALVRVAEIERTLLVSRDSEAMASAMSALVAAGSVAREMKKKDEAPRYRPHLSTADG